MAVNPLRHMAIFNPDKWGDRLVDVIGAGATGSKVVMELAKLGIRRIRVWDKDTVAEHNIANQGFGLSDIGKLKVEALKARVLADTGIEIEAKPVFVTGAERLGHVVFLLTDSMESRREIWSKGIKLKAHVKLLIETRMGAQHGFVYVINPLKPAQIREYEKTLKTEAQVERSACGSAVSLGASSSFLASLAVMQLIRAFAIETAEPGKEDDELESEIMFFLRPTNAATRVFK